MGESLLFTLFLACVALLSLRPSIPFPSIPFHLSPPAHLTPFLLSHPNRFSILLFSFSLLHSSLFFSTLSFPLLSLPYPPQPTKYHRIDSIIVVQGLSMCCSKVNGWMTVIVMNESLNKSHHTAVTH